MATTSRLARPDSRPLLVTLVVAGWLILSGFGGLRALVVLGNAASTSYFGVQDPMARMAAEVPELVGEDALRHLAMQRALRSLDLQLAGPLLVAALLAGFGALRLLRRRRWSRTLLLGVGLLAIAISATHAYRSVQITTVDAAGIQEAEETLPAFYAVAGINVALQSLPLVLVMSLLRHPIVRRYVSGSSEAVSRSGAA
jgi:hypothetical protein